LFLLIFLWTPPHFWALAIKHSDDYKAAGVPMLPVVESHEKVIASMVRYTIALTLCSLAVVPVGNMGWVYGISAAVLGGAFLWGTIALGRSTSPAASMRLFTFSISYVTVLFVALTVDVFVR
jgi:protoheme IX farnesyltransferase